MGRGFNPAALMGLGAAINDDCEVVAVSDDEMRRISGAEVRRKCAGIKLAARIIGMASAGRDGVDDQQVLLRMQALTARMAALRKEALTAVDVARDSPDYKAAYNVVTDVVMDVLTEEWKWTQLGADVKPLLIPQIGKLLEIAANSGPEFVGDADPGDLALCRRLCILETAPKIWGVVNMFDYFQKSRENMVAEIVRAVSAQAERHASTLYSETTPSFAVKAIVQRLYSVSAGLMCEVYKDLAARDVSVLRALPDMDRSVVMIQYEQAGMKYEHIITRHRAVMERTLDTTHMILEAHTEPRKAKEHSYAR